jgi:hypothetical protein
VQPDANPQRPRTVGQVAPIDLHKDLLCRGNGMMSGGRVVKRGAEDRHEAVAEEFVDEATLSVDRLDHEAEGGIEELDNLFGLPATGVRHKLLSFSGALREGRRNSPWPR